MLTIVLLAFITTTVGGFIALTVGDTIAWIAACISLGAFVEFGIGPGIILVLTILITCLVGCYQFDEWRKRRSYADPGAVKLAYMSWKDKYCAKITFDYVQKQ
jgi:Zn-dependent protease with chaperone function